MDDTQVTPTTLEYITQLEPAEFSEEEINILRKVNQKIAGAPNLEQTMNYLFEATRNISHCDRVSVAFLDEDRQRIVSHYTKADYEPVLLDTGYAQDLAGSSLEKIIQAGRCRLIGDLEQYAQQHPQSKSTKLLLAEGVRSNMTCPLKVEGRTVGLLFRSAKQPYAFSRHQVRIHLAITERLSQAIEKAYMIERLAAANQAYMEMLGFVTHELKSPIANLVMTANLLQDGLFGELQPQQKEKIQRIVFNGEYLLTLIRDYLNLAQLETGTLEIHPTQDVDFITEVIEPAIEMIQPWLMGKNLRLHREFSRPICICECDRDLMRIVMINLLNNAAKYGNKDGLIRVKVDCNDERVQAAVWNEGPGFRKEDQDKLFRKFSRLNDPKLRKAKGTGVGLYTVWRIINQHAGKIIANSEYGQWAEFSLHFPVPLPKTPEGKAPIAIPDASNEA